MNSLFAKSICLAAALQLAIPAFAAAGITPPDTVLSMTGASTMNKLVGNAQTIWGCQISFALRTGVAVGSFTPERAAGGSILSGTAGSGNCTAITFDPTNFVITSSDAQGGTGVLQGINIKQYGQPWCSTGANVPFIFYNEGDAPSHFYFDNVQFNTSGGNCLFGADLKACPDINVVA